MPDVSERQYEFQLQKNQTRKCNAIEIKIIIIKKKERTGRESVGDRSVFRGGGGSKGIRLVSSSMSNPSL